MFATMDSGGECYQGLLSQLKVSRGSRDCCDPLINTAIAPFHN